MPLPIEMLLRMKGSPVPAQTTFGSEGATASDADGGRVHLVEDRRPVDAAVGRLEDAARRGADVVDLRVARHAHDRADAVADRADVPVGEGVEERVARGRRRAAGRRPAARGRRRARRRRRSGDVRRSSVGRAWGLLEERRVIVLERPGRAQSGGQVAAWWHRSLALRVAQVFDLCPRPGGTGLRPVPSAGWHRSSTCALGRVAQVFDLCQACLLLSAWHASPQATTPVRLLVRRRAAVFPHGLHRRQASCVP